MRRPVRDVVGRGAGAVMDVEHRSAFRKGYERPPVDELRGHAERCSVLR